MRSQFKIIAIFMMLGALMSFMPVNSEETVIKDDIVSNRPFAGTINNYVVGSDVCCDYWISPDEMSDTIVFEVVKPLFWQHFGMVYRINVLYESEKLLTLSMLEKQKQKEIKRLGFSYWH